MHRPAEETAFSKKFPFGMYDIEVYGGELTQVADNQPPVKSKDMISEGDIAVDITHMGEELGIPKAKKRGLALVASIKSALESGKPPFTVKTSFANESNTQCFYITGKASQDMPRSELYKIMQSRWQAAVGIFDQTEAGKLNKKSSTQLDVFADGFRDVLAAEDGKLLETHPDLLNKLVAAAMRAKPTKQRGKTDE